MRGLLCPNIVNQVTTFMTHSINLLSDMVLCICVTSYVYTMCHECVSVICKIGQKSICKMNHRLLMKILYFTPLKMYSSSCAIYPKIHKARKRENYKYSSVLYKDLTIRRCTKLKQHVMSAVPLYLKHKDKSNKPVLHSTNA